MNKAAVILAAGMGTRMKSSTPKVLHKVAGKPILGHVIAAARAAGATKIVVVTSPDGQAVRDYAAREGADAVIQAQQLGTGHAAACAAPALKEFTGVLAVTYGDMPLLTSDAFEASFAAQEKTGMAIVAFEALDPAAYGRVILNAAGLLDRIVEFKDGTEQERAVTLCNAGLLAADAQSFFRWAAKLKNDNAQHEYYLTDIPLLARAEDVACAVARTAEENVMGVNSRAELSTAEAAMQTRLRNAALAAGVGMVAPETVYLSSDTVLEADVQIEPFVVFAPGVTVKSGAVIKSFSHLEGATVGEGALIGPYARLRPGAQIEENVHIGNFVEIKKSRIEKGAKANHLSYIGDARVGAGANIGAGTITCNYDGFGKYQTDIGAGAFIGSNASLVAPVKIGDGAITGAGSTITKDVEANALAVTRSEQKQIKNWAESFRAKKKAAKAKGEK
ncbi:MAG TPA: bifunctional UDP-N-acetylglucosamine diphosphorylase/glucosamine-1-phosphate N-acetyltransferase GlmU [Rhizomicrobium sp.]|nr:bifunctional UDP-N-acetylglucosamine diphosphorylase/glucosamine-1-phosphate N-acetyltransferase GlmU [Rhizomicrobium sp.]